MPSFVNRLKEIENNLASVGHIVRKDAKRRALSRELSKGCKVTRKVIEVTGIAYEIGKGQLVMIENSMEEEKDTDSYHCCTVYRAKYEIQFQMLLLLKKRV